MKTLSCCLFVASLSAMTYSQTRTPAQPVLYEGARVIVDINADLLKGVDAALYDDIIASFDAIDATLSKYDNGDGTYQSYDQLTDDDRKPIQAELATLSENLSKVAAAFGLEVS